MKKASPLPTVFEFSVLRPLHPTDPTLLSLLQVQTVEKLKWSEY